MANIGTLPGERLAGLSADLFHKVRKGIITLDEFALFNQRKNPFESVKAASGSLLDLAGAPDFEPAFIGIDWDVESDEDATIAALDVSKVKLETCLKNGEFYTTGEERLKRLKKMNVIRLGGKAFRFFWENQHLIPESWKERTNGRTTSVFFDGLILRSPFGLRFSLHLYWGDERWYWHYYWLDGDRIADFPSAVVASGA